MLIRLKINKTHWHNSLGNEKFKIRVLNYESENEISLHLRLLFKKTYEFNKSKESQKCVNNGTKAMNETLNKSHHTYMPATKTIRKLILGMKSRLLKRSNGYHWLLFMIPRLQIK
jgi:predicted RNA-binding protein with RPS1 domain